MRALALGTSSASDELECVDLYVMSCWLRLWSLGGGGGGGHQRCWPHFVQCVFVLYMLTNFYLF